MVEGYEPYEFVRFFPWWQDFDVNGNRPANVNGILGKYDAMSLIQRPHLAAESQLIDDGHGELIIYRVGPKGDIIEIPKRNNVSLFSGDCYLIHYVLTVCRSAFDFNFREIPHILYEYEISICILFLFFSLLVYCYLMFLVD